MYIYIYKLIKNLSAPLVVSYILEKNACRVSCLCFIDAHPNGLKHTCEQYLHSDKIAKLVQRQWLQRCRFSLRNFIEAISNCNILERDRDSRSLRLQVRYGALNPFIK